MPTPRPQDTSRTGARGRPAFAARARLRILIAEDNTDAGESLKLLLEELGYEAYLVADGKAAVVAAQVLEPDVIIMDIGLPVINGYEATRRIRAQSRSPRLRIVALTGWGKLEDLRMAARAGIDHHFLKPLDLPKLRALLASFMPRESNAMKPARRLTGARTER